MKLMQANANSNSKSNGVEEFLGKRIGGFDATNIFILGHAGCEINYWSPFSHQCDGLSAGCVRSAAER